MPPETCEFVDCGKTLISGYTKHGDPLCYQHFAEYIEDMLSNWDDDYWDNDYTSEDAFLDNEEAGRELWEEHDHGYDEIGAC